MDVHAKSWSLGPSGSDAGYNLPPLESWTLFSDALKPPEWFLSTQLLSMQFGAEVLVQFRVMLIYRSDYIYPSSVNVWMFTPEYQCVPTGAC